MQEVFKGWYVCKPLFDTIWKGVPTIICHSMPHTSADINKYYNGEYIPEDQIITMPEMLERYNVTAINIPVCIKETIELMKEITPEMKKVVLLSDDRFICSLIRKKAEDIHQQTYISSTFLIWIWNLLLILRQIQKQCSALLVSVVKRQVLSTVHG